RQRRPDGLPSRYGAVVVISDPRPPLSLTPPETNYGNSGEYPLEKGDGPGGVFARFAILSSVETAATGFNNESVGWSRDQNSELICIYASPTGLHINQLQGPQGPHK
ncbi:hypothetical protein THAOC_16303, partial [Thalassiosira oceanica]